MIASKQGILQRILGRTGLTTKLENIEADSVLSPDVSADNYIINGGFDFWQRAASGTCSNSASGSYVAADRWKISGYNAGVGYASTDVAKDTSPPSGSKFGLKLSSNTASNDAICALQYIESINALSLVGKKVTISAKIKKLAGYNADTPIVMSIWYLNSADVAASEVATSMTDATLIGTYNHTPVSSDWERVSLTVNIPSSGANGLAIRFSYSKSNMGAAEIFSIANVMLNIGTKAAPFVRAGKTIGGELALCQRYYEKSADIDTDISAHNLYSTAYTGASSRIFVKYNVTKRGSPIITTKSDAATTTGTSSLAYSVTGVNNYTDGSIVYQNQSGFNLITPNANSGAPTRLGWISDAEL